MGFAQEGVAELGAATSGWRVVFNLEGKHSLTRMPQMDTFWRKNCPPAKCKCVEKGTVPDGAHLDFGFEA